MADKAISELVAAEQITATDMFVLEQNGTAKKLTGQVLMNWLTAAADGHGGIKSIAKLSTSGLAITYRITLADTTTFDFVVTNGKGVSSIAKTSTSGLVDTYTITFNDNTKSTFTVTNGSKGDKGDNTYVWIKYASQQPTSSSNSFGDVPDAWIGIYFGSSASAPTNWQQYKWYQWKGAKGDPGDPAKLLSSKVEYQIGNYGNVAPSGSWSTTVPTVPQGKYLWTRTTNTFNSGSPVVSYTVSRFGVDGTGSMSSVNNVSPDSTGNVTLTAADLNALSANGGTVSGDVTITGMLNGGIPLEIGQYIDFHKNASDVTDYAGRLFVDPNSGHLVYENTVDPSSGGPLLASGKISVFYSVPLNFTAGKATYTNANITATDAAFVQRRSSSVGTALAFTSTSNAGSLTVCGAENLSGTISVNIIVMKTT